MTQTSPTNGRLFSLPTATPKPTVMSQGSALGAAAESLLIAELLERGHKVAVPVVDDDGVDLIVNYAINVQVKSTVVRKDARREALRVELNRGRYRNGELRGRRTLKPHVDVLAVFARDTRTWWFVTRERINGRKRIELSTSTRFSACLDAWDVFDVETRTQSPHAG